MKRRTFEIGDHVRVASAAHPETTGEIQAVRHAVGNTRMGTLSLGCDLLLADGRVVFHYLHDLARWNPEIVEHSFKGDQT